MRIYMASLQEAHTHGTEKLSLIHIHKEMEAKDFLLLLHLVT